MPDPTSFCGLMAALRAQQTLTFRALAAKAKVSKSLLSDLETGRRTPTVTTAAAVDRALGAKGTLEAMADAERRAALWAEAGGRRGEEDPMRRRTLLKQGGGLLALGAVDALSSRLSASESERIGAHRAIRAAHGQMDNLAGAGSIYAQALDHHRSITGWLTSATSADERARIAALASDTGGFVGFLTYDLGNPELAAHHYRTAASHARLANDRSHAVNLMGQQSRISADQGRLDEALTLTDRALEIAGTRAHPAVRSWLHAVRAHHHALLSQAGANDQSHAKQADVDLHSAWTLLDVAHDGEVPPYIGYLSTAELQKWTGHTMLRLGDKNALKRGRTALDEAHTIWPSESVRGAAEMLTSSASIHLASGDHEAADAVITTAVSIATATGSARNLRAALAVQTRLATT
ncbi:helix-turn-helix domain-containing protein [Streptomyces sp. NPDC001933]|uniref:helix-turn-helix domain-containing protein n=1 Tax=Streptomyces sp. NPDC001933 TaxID=3364626 RepID=UPI0036AC15C3